MPTDPPRYPAELTYPVAISGSMIVATARANPEARVTTAPSSRATSPLPTMTTGAASRVGMFRWVLSSAAP